MTQPALDIFEDRGERMPCPACGELVTCERCAADIWWCAVRAGAVEQWELAL